MNERERARTVAARTVAARTVAARTVAAPTATTAWTLLAASLLAAAAAAACGPKLTEAEARDQRSRLRSALAQPVRTREERDAQSRLVAEIADSGALQGLDQAELRAAIGKGMACRHPVCAQNGFGPDDYYYEIGVIEGDAVKQLPVLIVGFDPGGRATRIWTLTTH